MNNKKHILYITSRSDIGGGPKHLHDLAKTLLTIEKNYSITIAAPSGHYYSKYQKIAHNTILIPFRKFQLSTYLKLIKYIRSNGVTHIHSHGRGAGIYSRLLSLFTNATIIHTFHGIHNENTLIGQVKFFLDFFLKHLTHTFICVSPDELTQAIDYNLSNKNNTCSILNGIDIDQYKDGISSPVNKSTWGTIARFNYQKGYDIALDFISEYQNELRKMNALFIFQGHGETFDQINEKVKALSLSDLITLPGPTTKPIEFFKKINYYISFSRWEGFPISVIEAMACQKPCILSSVVGHKTFIERNTVHSFTTGDFSKLINLMKTIDSDSNNLVQVTAQEFLNKELTICTMTKKTARLYN